MIDDRKSEGMLVVLSAPSGCGKDTVLDGLGKKAGWIKRSISLTTRNKRDGEKDGEDYYFVSRDYFLSRLDSGQILEHTTYSGNFYGTPKSTVDEWLKNGETVILKIEVEGAGKIKELYHDSISIFLIPPSMKALEERLRCRMSESEEEIQSRLTIALNEMKNAVSYDFIVINDDVDKAIDDVYSIIVSEGHRTSRSTRILNESMSF
ncbi:MAG: guanylate kinase [Clostridiales bacterium]|jgi:guanylate kinase|nr:guanylate kinase [Clostridiales bacterium]